MYINCQVRTPLLTTLLALSFVLLASSAASADMASYTNESDFVAKLAPGYYNEDFSALIYWGNVVTTDSTAHSVGPENGFSYNISAPRGLYAWDFALSTNYAEPITIVFTGDDVYAAGGTFWPQDKLFNDAAGSIRVTAYDINGNTKTVDVDSTVDIYGFGGIVSTTPLASLTLEGLWQDLTPNDPWDKLYVTMDDFYVGNIAPVPVPGAVLLGSLGLVLAGWIQRRRKGIDTPAA